MIDSPNDDIEQVAAELIQQGWIRREEICAQLGIGDDLLDVCIQWQIIEQPEVGPDGNVMFSSDAVDRLCRGLRLHRDLGVNWPGVSVAMDLLERIEHLEKLLQTRLGSEWMNSETETKTE